MVRKMVKTLLGVLWQTSFPDDTKLMSCRTLVWCTLQTKNIFFFFCSEELFVNAGATHGVSLLSSVFFESGDTVFVEDPSYFIAFRIFKMFNFNIVGSKKTTQFATHCTNIIIVSL